MQQQDVLRTDDPPELPMQASMLKNDSGCLPYGIQCLIPQGTSYAKRT